MHAGVMCCKRVVRACPVTVRIHSHTQCSGITDRIVRLASDGTHDALVWDLIWVMLRYAGKSQGSIVDWFRGASHAPPNNLNIWMRVLHHAMWARPGAWCYWSYRGMLSCLSPGPRKGLSSSHASCTDLPNLGSSRSIAARRCPNPSWAAGLGRASVSGLCDSAEEGTVASVPSGSELQALVVNACPPPRTPLLSP